VAGGEGGLGPVSAGAGWGGVYEVVGVDVVDFGELLGLVVEEIRERYRLGGSCWSRPRVSGSVAAWGVVNLSGGLIAFRPRREHLV
jgi:hypothetical protein